jgi:dienelactone hydrolase
MLAGYQQRNFSAPIGRSKISHDVYSRGDQGPTVVIIQELPGIGPETLSLGDQLSEQGYRVVLPHLFGPLGRISLLGNLGRVFCMRKEFKFFAKNASSPVVDWLRALCKDLKENQHSSAIGVIGMCLTGNFAISMMADDHILAGVASQPSMPLNSQSDLHMSEDEVVQVRNRLDTHGPMLAMRFEGDRLCTAEKFRVIDEAFNDDVERIQLVELPGRGHSVLTLDFAKRAEVTEAAFASVLEYFDSKLKVS